MKLSYNIHRLCYRRPASSPLNFEVQSRKCRQEVKTVPLRVECKNIAFEFGGNRAKNSTEINTKNTKKSNIIMLSTIKRKSLIIKSIQENSDFTRYLRKFNSILTPKFRTNFG